MVEETIVNIPTTLGSSTPETKAQPHWKKLVPYILFTTAVLAAFVGGRATSSTTSAAGLGSQAGTETSLRATGETLRNTGQGTGYGSLPQELSQIWAAIDGLRADSGAQNAEITTQLNQESADREAALAQLNISLQTTSANLEDQVATTSANLATNLQQAVTDRQDALAATTSTLQSSISSLSTTLNDDLTAEAAARDEADSNLENILACRPGFIRDPNDSTKCIPCGENQFWSALAGGCSDCPAHSTSAPGSTNCACDQGYALSADNQCEDVDECATNNGGCGDAALVTCTNNAGAAPTCEDVDECATNNGGCGDAAFFTCTNNAGAAPTCEDVDECATNNGGCGDAALFTCTNNVGAAPTCEELEVEEALCGDNPAHGFTSITTESYNGAIDMCATLQPNGDITFPPMNHQFSMGCGILEREPFNRVSGSFTYGSIDDVSHPDDSGHDVTTDYKAGAHTTNGFMVFGTENTVLKQPIGSMDIKPAREWSLDATVVPTSTKLYFCNGQQSPNEAAAFKDINIVTWTE